MMKFAAVCSIFGKVGKCLRSCVLCEQNVDLLSATTKNFKILKPSRKIMQTGRTIVEMLAVLAIVGILSVGELLFDNMR